MTKRQTKRKEKPPIDVQLSTVQQSAEQLWRSCMQLIKIEPPAPCIGFVQRGEHRWPVVLQDLKRYRKEGFVAIGREGSKMVAHLHEYEF